MFKVTFRDSDGNDVFKAKLKELPKIGSSMDFSGVTAEVTHVMRSKEEDTIYVYLQDVENDD